MLLVVSDYDGTTPQGLRWVQFASALADLGWQIDVATWPARGESPAHHPRISVHAQFPGPIRFLFENYRRGRGRSPMTGNSHRTRLTGTVRRISGAVVYPNLRREGLPFLRRGVRKLLRTNPYDVAVLSHESEVCLEMLDLIRASRIPVVADLGDPVLAFYTPRHWRRRAHRLERHVCRFAQGVVVTNQVTLDLLRRRHGTVRHGAVITQGFDPGAGAGRTQIAPADPLRVVYTGTFYSFRDPRPTIDAVSATAGVELVLAVTGKLFRLDPALTTRPHVTTFDELPRRDAYALQDGADVLLVLGNEDSTHTPGKLFEYLRLPAPILYVKLDANDSAADLVLRLGRGVVCDRDAESIGKSLTTLRDLKREGRLTEAFDLSPETVAEFAWSELAKKYDAFLRQVIAAPAPAE